MRSRCQFVLFLSLLMPMAAQAGAGDVTVPMDSWIYPALDRLSAMGFIRSQVAGVRPWTRRQCLYQLREADARFAEREDAAAAAAMPILQALHRELDGDRDDPPVVVETAYMRSGIIAGDYLNDSYHFGQTWRNGLGQRRQRLQCHQRLHCPRWTRPLLRVDAWRVPTRPGARSLLA